MYRSRLLGVLLCYNDGDILEDNIRNLLENGHDVLVWNHGSTDETSRVLNSLRGHLVEVTDISRSVDFYDMYPLMSKHVIENYAADYDWISWPDQDEILEGPTREKSYRAFLEEAVESPHNWIEFSDFVYWFTERDDPKVSSPCDRVRHYSLARHGPLKIRSWRASATNIRWFNHNKTTGTRVPERFNLRHYPMRSESQMKRRVSRDRANLRFGPVNYHYENMKASLATTRIRADELHYDDGRSELDPSTKFNWRDIYGVSPPIPREVAQSFVLATKKWEVAEVVKKALNGVMADAARKYGRPRLDQWLQSLDRGMVSPVVVTVTRNDVRFVMSELAHEWTPDQGGGSESDVEARIRTVNATMNGRAVAIWGDAVDRCIGVSALDDDAHADEAAGQRPLVALVPCLGAEAARIADFDRDRIEFRRVNGQYYYLVWEPPASSIRSDVH
jgi:hypothetical protein